MKELNLEVGQKVWSIQLGDCNVYDKSAKLIYCSNGKRTQSYVKDGKKFEEDECQSLFESNPFYRSVDTNETIEPKLVRQKNDGCVENKAELINALYIVANAKDSTLFTSRKIAQDKLQKLLESL